jgi:hypothetical protein
MKYKLLMIFLVAIEYTLFNLGFVNFENVVVNLLVFNVLVDLNSWRK